MSKKMRLWMAGTVGVLMAGFMSVSVYALEEKDVIGTWYVNELSMGEGASFHPGAMGMEVTVDIKEDGKIETTSSVYGEEPEVDEELKKGIKEEIRQSLKAFESVPEEITDEKNLDALLERLMKDYHRSTGS